MKDHNLHKHKPVVTGFYHQLLMVDLIRHFIVKTRFVYFTKIKRKIKTLENPDKGVAINTIDHNLKGIQDFAAVRPVALIKPLCVIESLSKDSKILTIGPRSEGEIFALIGYGFMPKNITGLDLISYSPWVKLGDMHKIPFEDNSFDVVVLGWVISYSHEPETVAKEVSRVLKPGGIVTIGVEHGGEEGQKQVEQLQYTPGAGRQTQNANELIKFFGDRVDHVYFNHSILPDRVNLKGSVISVFSIKK